MAMKKRYLVLGIILLAMAAPLVLEFRPGLELEVAAQQRRRPRRRSRRGARAPVASATYKSFLHGTPRHRSLACDACHKAPTPNSLSVRQFPVVADYPDHASCIECHRQQFFVGAQPAICTICHTVVSPRSGSRFPFSKPGGREEFAINFPHDKHQDFLALMNRAPANTRDISFGAHARGPSPANDDKAQFYNCSICHETLSQLPKSVPNEWSASFKPEAGFFKSAPTGHQSCFECHYRAQQPVMGNCGGCHVVQTTSPQTYSAFGNRISPKFSHETDAHRIDCRSCHINITQSSSVRGLKPDVPITSCATSSCHGNSGNKKEYIGTELDAGKGGVFNCVLCHTPRNGTRPPPATHYLAIGRKAPAG
jgi:hypothetical protein